MCDNGLFVSKEIVSMICQAKFNIGQIIDHHKFGYRGVIFEVDPVFSLSDEWYEQVAKTRPPKDQPWYHVLVDDNVHSTYVAERNLIAAINTAEIRHPDLDLHFISYEDGKYIPAQVSM